MYQCDPVDVLLRDKASLVFDRVGQVLPLATEGFNVEANAPLQEWKAVFDPTSTDTYCIVHRVTLPMQINAVYRLNAVFAVNCNAAVVNMFAFEKLKIEGAVVLPASEGHWAFHEEGVDSSKHGGVRIVLDLLPSVEDVSVTFAFSLTLETEKWKLQRVIVVSAQVDAQSTLIRREG